MDPNVQTAIIAAFISGVSAVILGLIDARRWRNNPRVQSADAVEKLTQSNIALLDQKDEAIIDLRKQVSDLRTELARMDKRLDAEIEKRKRAEAMVKVLEDEAQKTTERVRQLEERVAVLQHENDDLRRQLNGLANS